MGKQDHQGQGVQVSTVGAIDLPMTLEELDRIEAETRRLRADPMVRLDLRVRRSEQRKLDEYAAANSLDSRSEAGRHLIREGLIRWEHGGEHGGV